MLILFDTLTRRIKRGIDSRSVGPTLLVIAAKLYLTLCIFVGERILLESQS